MLDGVGMDDPNGDFSPGNGQIAAMITDQSSAARIEHAAAESVITHQLHLLSRRMYKKK